MKVESITQQGIGRWTKATIASVALAGSLGCGIPDSGNNMISLHCSPDHNRPLPVIGKTPRHLDVKIYPIGKLPESADLTVVVVGYRFTITRFIKEVVPVLGQNPNATRIAHLPSSLSATHGDRVEVVSGALTRNQIEARQGIYVASARITAQTMSCAHN